MFENARSNFVVVVVVKALEREELLTHWTIVERTTALHAVKLSSSLRDKCVYACECVRRMNDTCSFDTLSVVHS